MFKHLKHKVCKLLTKHVEDNLSENKSYLLTFKFIVASNFK